MHKIERVDEHILILCKKIYELWCIMKHLSLYELKQRTSDE